MYVTIPTTMGLIPPNDTGYYPAMARAFLALVLGTFMAMASSARAASISIEEIVPDLALVHVQGVIEPGDAARFTRTIMDPVTRRVRTDIASVVLNSPGGVVSEGNIIGAEIKIARLPVFVPRDAICASACFMLLASAPVKEIRGSVGIHGASANGVETAEAMAETVGMARILAARGVPQSVIGRMVTTPASEIVWLTSEEIASLPGYRAPGAQPWKSYRPPPR